LPEADARRSPALGPSEFASPFARPDDAAPIAFSEIAARWMALLRYHKPTQLIRRLVSRGRKSWLRANGGGRFARAPHPLPEIRGAPALRGWLDRKLETRADPGSDARAAEIVAGCFRFLGESRLLAFPIDWRLAGHGDVDPLWRFHLHYHEFLLDLLTEGSYDLVWRIVRQWIEGNRLADSRVLDDAWHPFSVSKRMPVWMLAWQACPPPDHMQAAVVASLAQQAEFLAAHLERDVGGNHLLENAKALVLAGIFFRGPGSDRWRAIGRTVLYSEISRQILPYGEHFERSPMYHSQTLATLIDIRDAARDVDPELSQFCSESAVRMALFLKAILHPDGDIPLLGDSALGEAPPPSSLIHAAQPSGGLCAMPPEPDTRHARCIGPYWTWRCDGDYLLWDGGPVGPDHLPAHAHSDLLTLEASIRGRRVIVDSGVFHYRDDAARRYCRSTAAHNVLQLDGREQCDTWSRFRMGYRGHPTAVETGRWHDFDWACCRHDAFRRLGVPWVARWVACRPRGPWLIVDWAAGSGREYELCEWLHFHPDVELRLTSAGTAEFTVGPARWTVEALTQGDLEIVPGHYCPRFGERISAPILRWASRHRLPAACGWQLTPADCDHRAVLDRSDADGLRLRWQDTDLVLPLTSG
jgi:hypothetical protein